MEMLVIVLAVASMLCLLLAAMLILVKFLAVEAWAAVRGQTSPRLLRRQERERQRRDEGVTTIGHALSARLVHRIENPPQRRWAIQLRLLFAELAADAVAEARVRHQHNVWERARRRAQQRATFHARTGGGWAAQRPAPPSPPEDDGDDTEPCRGGCGTFVVPPEEMCAACERTPSPPPRESSDPDTEPIPTVTTLNTTDREEPPMGIQDHTIDADVRDPRTALRFANSCRVFNDAIVGQLEILAATMTRVGVGTGPVSEIRILEDAARTYSASNARSVTRYAEHVVAQADIAGDDDVRDTVRRTYLDTHGTDASPPQSGGGATATIHAADCDTPAAAEHFMRQVDVAYTAMKGSVDHVKGTHQRQGVTGEPITFLEEQLELASTLADKAQKAASTFRRHIRRRDDTVGKDSSLHGTQQGKYLDPARA